MCTPHIHHHNYNTCGECASTTPQPQATSHRIGHSRTITYRVPCVPVHVRCISMYLPVVKESKVDATRYLCSINPFQHPSHTLIAASSKFLERNKQHLPRHSHLVPHLSINCIGILFVHLHLLNS